MVKTDSDGYPNSTRIIVKPNWTGAGPKDGKPVYEKLGVNTDPHYIEGWVQGMKEVGPEKYRLTSGNRWDIMPWRKETVSISETCRAWIFGN